MHWNELDAIWQKVFELCWEAFGEGNLPIAAIIADKDGKILSTGKNNINISEKFLNPKVDHAETECVQMLDVTKYPQVKDYILYTSMEPCPMCMGTIVMGNIRKVRVAAGDPWAGSADLCFKSDYIASKNMDVQFVEERWGTVSMILQVYAELKADRKVNSFLERLELTCPEAVSLGRVLFEDKILDRYVKEHKPVEYVFNHLCNVLSLSVD